MTRMVQRQNSSKLKMFRSIPVCVFVALTVISECSCFFGDWGPDLAGPWCAQRRRGQDCCTGRNDDCAVPILGTECYCDIFCNETAYDCCPDYWPHCHGFEHPTPTPRPTTMPTPRPKEICYKDNRVYNAGDTIQDHCNTCTCEMFFSPDRRYDWRCTDDVCLIRPELVRSVNDGQYSWRASNYSKFWSMTLDDGIKLRLGTFLLPDNVLRMTPLRVQDDVLPETFDARQKWPNMLHPIRDQGNCASSWAHSTTAVASDRLAIETNGQIQDEMSAQHLLSCNTDGQKGCDGGHLDRAWWYLRKHGVVTEQCYPYRSGQTDDAGQCLISARQQGGVCPSGVQYKQDKRYKATPPYRIRPLEREIMKEILDNGPVQATFEVREDFFMYSSGVYSYTDLPRQRRESVRYRRSGFHSARIVGWGAERNFRGDIIKYWICANSWGSDWGEEGFFRIRRGTDESRIERYVVGVWGKITGDNLLRQLLLQNRRKRLRSRGGRRQLRTLNRMKGRRLRKQKNKGRRNRRNRSNKNKLAKKSKWMRHQGKKNNISKKEKTELHSYFLQNVKKHQLY